LDDTRNELVGAARRLETLSSLGNSNLSKAPSAVVQRVFDACNQYFHRHPYRLWFNKLEKVLNCLKSSYFDGSACHVDLVQWATDPAWRDLTQSEQSTLLRSDIPFLQRQLCNEQIEVLLLNGNGIVRAFQDNFGCTLTRVPGHRALGRIQLWRGRLPSGLVAIGWNINLQSSFGVKNSEIDSIGKVVCYAAAQARGST